MATVRKRVWKTSRGSERSAWCVDFVDSNGTRGRRHCATKREADAFRSEIEAQLRAGTFRPDAAKVTVKEACETYLEHVRGRMKRGERFTQHHLKNTEGHVWNYLCPDPTRHSGGKRPPRLREFHDGIGAIKLAQLTASKVSDFRDRLRDADVSVPTTRKILGTLQCVLEHAIRWDLVAVNAAKSVTVIGRRDEGGKKIVPPTKEVMRQLIQVADQDFRVKLIVASATGVRAGEFHALRWRHLDLDAGEVAVETRVDAYGEEDVTKTEAGMRTVPLGTAVVSELRKWKLRSKIAKPDDLVFPNRRGSYENHDNLVKRHFLPLFDRLSRLHEDEPERHAPAPARFNWHALRHFAISTWIDAGLSPKTVQTFAGHSSLQVTMDRYGHLFPDDSHKAAMDEIADGLLG